MTEQKKSLNNWFTGILAGLIFPWFGAYIFYKTQHIYYGFAEFIKQSIEYNVATKLLSVSLLANLAIFYFFIHTKKYISAKAVIAMTFIYGMIMMIYMFLF